MGEATDRRNEFMALVKAIDIQRAELAKLIGELSRTANAIIGEADLLLTASSDEKEAERGTTVKRVTYSTPTGRTDATQPNVIKQRVGQEVRVVEVPKLGPGKRACSNCRQPGHRAKNCTAPPRVKRRRTV